MIKRLESHSYRNQKRKCLLLLLATVVSLLISGCGGGADDSEEPPANGTIIGQGGGVVSSTDKRVTLTIPAGALSADTEITVTQNKATGPGSLVTPYTFGPEGTTFDKPISVTITYTDSDIPVGADPGSIMLTRQYNGYFWRTITNSTVDTIAKTVTAQVNGFSTYGLTLGSYSAQLDGQQQVPATSSSATGIGSFHIDTVHNLMAYEINLQNLEGSETASHIHGPAARGEDSAPAVHTLPIGNPKLGQWQYDESLEADILAGRMYVNIHTDQFSNGEIRGQIEPAGAIATNSNLSVKIGVWDISTGMSSANQTPTSVNKITLEVDGPGMSVITRDATVTNEIEESFSVAKGVARRIRAEAYDNSDQLIYQSVYFTNTLSDNQTVHLTMRVVGDNTVPVFSGASGSSKISGESTSLTWTVATDDVTASSDILYLIYLASKSGGQDYSWPTLVTVPGEIQPTISGLSPGQNYYVVVRAMDQSGNIDTNAQEIVASTYSDGSGLYVDEKNGADTSSCGSTTSPCKTIGRAISLTQGNEPIYVARGIYDSANGESFPLQLKAGSRLICEEPDVFLLPSDSSCTGNCLTTFLGGGYVQKTFPVVNIAGEFSTTLVSGADGAQLRSCEVNHLYYGDPGGVNPNFPPYAIEDNGSTMLVEGTQVTGFGGQYYAWAGVKFTGDGSQLRDSKMSGFVMNGLLVEGDDAIIKGNTFVNNEIGVRIRGNGASIINNNFSSTPDFISSQGITYGTQGIVSEPTTLVGFGPSELVIANNDFYGLFGLGILMQESTNIKITGNTLEGNGGGISIHNVHNVPSDILISRNRMVSNKTGLALSGGKANATLVANTLIQNSFVDLNITTDAVVDTSLCNSFDNLPPMVGVVGDTGCPPGGDICYALPTPTPIIPTGNCFITAIP